DAAVQGIRDLLDIPGTETIPAGDIEVVKMGTTVATNALLERRGEATALVITKGFVDALRIAYQNRPKIFARHIVLPEQLYCQVVEADERVMATGEVLRPVNLEQARAGLQKAFDTGVRSVAIVLMHGYCYPAHEQQLAALAKKIGFSQVSVSHEVSPLIKLVSRGDTTVVDAYLSPILRRYVDQVKTELGQTPLLFMQSNGGLVDADFFQGKDSILSGPAGGVVGAAKVCEQAGFEKIIGFDMGGTSTDVCHYQGELERILETEIAGVRLRTPMIHIHTVAAGGGSILHFDGFRYRVGPDSAGANPGPACYRRGGPLTVTDCNVMLRRILPDYFPSVFGSSGDGKLDRDVVNLLFKNLAHEVHQATGVESAPEQVAWGFLQVAVENMAQAVRKISVQRGYDVSDYTLCCFGGAGGQHACLLARALGMKRILLHQHAGVLSAYGMGMAKRRVLKEQSVDLVLDDKNLGVAEVMLKGLAQQARNELREQGVVTELKEENFLWSLHLRYRGADSSLMVRHGSLQKLRERFQKSHKQYYGFIEENKIIEIAIASVELVVNDSGVGASLQGNNKGLIDKSDRIPEPEAWTEIYGSTKDGETGYVKTPVYRRETLRAGGAVKGPALIMETNSTIVVERGWRAVLDAQGNLLLDCFTDRGRQIENACDPDPVRLEIFNNLFMSVAEQMGFTLEKVSHSVNMKERLDFSCALFDAEGLLVANAPHVPVHLGSMGESVQSIIQQRRDTMMPGDVYATNAPYSGGTHLPDITVVTPVFNQAQTEILFYLATRGHHADIGGLTPGSMPPGSRVVQEEGILLDNVALVRGGRFQETELLQRLQAGAYPARNPGQNIADLKAQIAANEQGMQALYKMIQQYGLTTVQAYMKHVQDNAETAVQKVIENLHDGEFSLTMDNGARIQVAVRVHKSEHRVTVDFTGTSPQQANNFNAPSAIAKAAVLYVFRTLVQDDIPLNAGCLKPINVILPKGCLLNPEYPAAVVAGNVETSQCIVDALYGALGIMAGSQGTMNNFTFGNERWQYYETLCGGSGAGPDHHGTDAVQVHMTNSRLTDAEVLEQRFPVLLEEFSIRENSGGDGVYRGGNGVRRRVRFLAPMTAAIVSNRRQTVAHGLEGGEPGKPGRNCIIRKDAEVIELGPCAQLEMNKDDVFIVKTPGGGGFGKGA
ncbi:MAG: hydantoinase B/oxoprolinase family protein, partial [Gammaproteobacteria bacterium]|nr:hydantoinase B/oxoprolinase family protein [Gammaproteobacteria bacterium]